MGTPQYMAPEQFEGREADARSDIWAFGAVLYEMLTGQRAFQGKSYSSLVGAILAADPPSMPAQRFTPTWLESLVRRCLQKDPEDRYQSMRDLVLDLRQPRAAETRRPGDRRWRWAAGAMAAVLAMGAGAGWVLSEAGGAANGRPVRFTVTPVGNGVFTTPPNTSVAAPQFALAPDGSALVFVAGPLSGPSLLWLRPLAEAVARPLAGTENALLPFWSPDSQWIGYFSDKQLKKVPARGGASQVLASDIADVFGGSWGPDQTIIFSAGAESISRIPAAGGTPSHVTVLNGARGEVAHRWPHFLPDGRHFLFYARAAREYGGLYLGSLDGSAAKFLFRSDSSAIYAPPGYLLYVEGDTLMARRFDARRFVAGDEAVALEEGVGRTTTSFSAVSAAAGGLLAYSGSILRPGRLTWFDRRGIAVGNVLDEADYIDFRLSPNEKRLAYAMVDRKTNSPKIWTADLERGSNTRITLGADTNVSVVWSPDGEHILFRSAQLGSSRFYQQSANGGTVGEWLMSPEMVRQAGLRSIALNATDWSADGQQVLFSAPSQSSGYDIWLLSPTGGSAPRPLIDLPGDQGHGNFSPDGKLVAYSSNESGRFEVYVQTVPRFERKVQVSTTGGAEPRWRADGREIYYLASDGRLMAAAVTPGPTFGVPQALFATPVLTPAIFQTHYVPAGNGQRFLVNAPRPRSDPPITVTLNGGSLPKR